ncbi:uncharacterized protein LOC6564246 [Drosophila grimshawi]|uniref:GH19316 n=1 Tax=Drosophila grimshawi TaxID=7222 RepID=B4JFG8_DROGR|nr:uncharacterized protein LOC6564246 [Drosophila grimshawi]EDV93449.1 GH19316 [Drosophila grimshawi]
MSRPELLTQISTDYGTAPAWLDEKVLLCLLKQEFPSFQSIENTRIRTEPNSLRVQIQAKLAENASRTINFVVKSQELSKVTRLRFPQASLGNFQMEQHMYKVVIPALETLYKDANRSISFSPTSYKPKTLPTPKESSCLYLEDLQAKGFRVVNQLKGLDQVSMEVMLSKLAAYHAATARYLQLNPHQLKELSKLESNKEPAQDIQNLKIWLQRKFHESLRANDLREYEDKVKSFQRHIAEDIDSPDLKKSFNVILTGACWSNNLLGQFDAFGQLKDVAFYQFGSVTYGPVVQDLLQLLLTAPAQKTEQFDACLRYYRDELAANLKLLKFEGKLPTLTDIQLDLLDYGHCAFEVITEILPIVLTDFGCEDIDEMFKLSKYSEEIKILLPWLENRGYFEA